MKILGLQTISQKVNGFSFIIQSAKQQRPQCSCSNPDELTCIKISAERLRVRGVFFASSLTVSAITGVKLGHRLSTGRFSPIDPLLLPYYHSRRSILNPAIQRYSPDRKEFNLQHLSSHSSLDHVELTHIAATAWSRHGEHEHKVLFAKVFMVSGIIRHQLFHFQFHHCHKTGRTLK